MNSIDRQFFLAVNQIGYRSIHYVCDIGEQRSTLPEFINLKDLKFEFQVRTVLQHAWAELAHDRNYKFSGKLPREIERKLYLYAGMLEIADKGFDEISQAIDLYIEDLKDKTREGELNIEINSLSIEQFVNQWAKNTGFLLEESPDKESHGELVSELDQFGIHTLADLMSIIPTDFVLKAAKLKYETNIYGLVRDWMLINDYKKYHDKVIYQWFGVGPGNIYPEYYDEDKLAELYDLFGGPDDYPPPDYADDYPQEQIPI